MNTLLNFVRKNITQDDRNLAMDYMSFYGIDESEAIKYVDDFLAICYTFNEKTGEHEERTPDELPFAEVKYLDNGFVSYSYNGCKIVKYEG